MSDAIPAEALLGFTDTVPDSGNPSPTADLTCEVCGTGLSYGGRGRKPRFCDEHKPARGKGSGRRSGGPIVDRAITEIGVLYGFAGQGVKFIDPAAGELIYDQRGKLAESYRLLLETNSRFRKLFADLEGKAAWLPIIAVHGDLIANIMIMRAVRKAEALVAQPVPEPSPPDPSDLSFDFAGLDV